MVECVQVLHPGPRPRIGQVVVLSVLVLVSGAVALVWMGSFPFVRFGADVPIFRTPYWEPDSGIYTAELLVKKLSDTEDILLLKRVGRSIVYQFDPTNNQLTRVASASFESASGPLSDCTQPVSAFSLLDYHPSEYSLDLRGHSVRAAGRLVMKAEVSPTGTKAAVLSAAGPIQWSLPFSGGNAWGQHYHQTLSIETGEFNGPSIGLPFVMAEMLVGICWSPAEEYVIYYDLGGDSFVFVGAKTS